MHDVVRFSPVEHFPILLSILISTPYRQREMLIFRDSINSPPCFIFKRRQIRAIIFYKLLTSFSSVSIVLKSKRKTKTGVSGEKYSIY